MYEMATLIESRIQNIRIDLTERNFRRAINSYKLRTENEGLNTETPNFRRMSHSKQLPENLHTLLLKILSDK